MATKKSQSNKETESVEVSAGFQRRLIVKVSGPPPCEKVYLFRIAVFEERPSKDEWVQVGKERHKITGFFHNIDSKCTDVLVRDIWTDDEEQHGKRVSELEKAGWQVMRPGASKVKKEEKASA